MCAGFYAAGFLLWLAYLTRTVAPNSANWGVPTVLLNSGLRLVLCAFVGVYLLNLATLVRRFYLIDISAQVLWAAVNRTLFAVGLAIPISLVFSAGGIAKGLDIAFFFIGFLANAFLHGLTKVVGKGFSTRGSGRDDFSLRMVRGIDFWKELRLEEEGIENAQNLATADVIELAIRTPFAVRTLIDWVDQAIVICRFGKKIENLENAGLNISAMELAASSPEATGKTDVVQAIVHSTSTEQALVTAQLNNLYEDDFVRELWTLWQPKREFTILRAIPAAVPASIDRPESWPPPPPRTTESKP